MNKSEKKFADSKQISKNESNSMDERYVDQIFVQNSQETLG